LLSAWVLIIDQTGQQAAHILSNIGAALGALLVLKA